VFKLDHIFSEFYNFLFNSDMCAITPVSNTVIIYYYLSTRWWNI